MYQVIPSYNFYEPMIRHHYNSTQHGILYHFSGMLSKDQKANIQTSKDVRICTVKGVNGLKHNAVFITDYTTKLKHRPKK